MKLITPFLLASALYAQSPKSKDIDAQTQVKILMAMSDYRDVQEAATKAAKAAQDAMMHAQEVIKAACGDDQLARDKETLYCTAPTQEKK